MEIKLEEVSLSLGEKKILEDLNLTFPSRAISILWGPSGAGKSTLLRLLNRLQDPSSGEIYLDHREIKLWPVIELRQQVGMISQLPYLFPGTVLDNLSYGPKLRGLKEDFKARGRELLIMVGLEEELLTRPAEQLSVGQKQRVNIARTLALGPKVLLLDEPTSALDEKASRQVLSLLVELREKLGLTLIMVTHSKEQAREIADHVVMLRDGRLEAQGGRELLLDRK